VPLSAKGWFSFSKAKVAKMTVQEATLYRARGTHCIHAWHMYVRVHANAPSERSSVLWSVEREAMLRMLGRDGNQRSEFISRTTPKRREAFDLISILKFVLINDLLKESIHWTFTIGFFSLWLLSPKQNSFKILFIKIDSFFVSHEPWKTIYKNRGRWKRLYYVSWSCFKSILIRSFARKSF